jgi:hypothetical protein
MFDEESSSSADEAAGDHLASALQKYVLLSSSYLLSDIEALA